MTPNIDPCDTARNNVLAAALALQQCTKTAANIVPIPGTGRFIAIGTQAEVAQLLELDTAAVTAQASTAQAEVDRLRSALLDVRHAVQFSSESVDGAITGDVQMIHHDGTVFDFIDATLSATSRTDAQAAAEVRDAIAQALYDAITTQIEPGEPDPGIDWFDGREYDAMAEKVIAAIRALRAGDTGGAQ